MLFFTKPEYKTVDMPFLLIEAQEDFEAGIISVETFGIVDGKSKFFSASFSLKKPSMYDDGSYDEILENLRATQGREISVVLKYRKNKLKSFKIDLDSLAFACVDDRLKELELLGWGVYDYSIKEKIEAENQVYNA